ncbi:KTSC domain-containing protein [Sphingobium faniae]|nr:KTSC domain-containing protein [Sphingobium faniae]
MPSTVIRRFDYDASAHMLDIQFVSGRRYRYFDVPEKVMERMRAAPSKGRFFNARVRGRYRFAQLR